MLANHAQRVLGAPETPDAHATLLHPKGRGNVVFATRAGPRGRWSEARVGISDVEYYARQLRGETDVYLTQNSFYGRRLVASLAHLDALFVDVDYRDVGLDGPPGAVLDKCLSALTYARQPEPTLALSTGRGLALVWLHGPVPPAALPRWNACQHALFDTLSHLGADARARDAARVLRLAGTYNGKVAQLVTPVAPLGQSWDFDALADEILPLTRAELYDIRIRRALKKKPERDRQALPKMLTQASLWELRLAELLQLLEMRWFGVLPPGQRDEWLFLAAVAMSWLAIPQVLRRESVALAARVGGWTDAESKSRLSAVYKRAQDAAEGTRVHYRNGTRDSRYRFRSDTIVERLRITPEEWQDFRQLVPSGIRRQRKLDAKRQRREAERRAAGQVTRSEYLSAANERRRLAREMHAAGASKTAIAKQLGVSVRTIRTYCE